LTSDLRRREKSMCEKAEKKKKKRVEVRGETAKRMPYLELSWGREDENKGK